MSNAIKFDELFSELTNKELLDLKNHIQSRIESNKKAELNNAKKQVKEIANNLGVDVADLFSSFTGEKKTSDRQPLAVKYRDPKNPDDTWTGRGKQPNWLKAKLAKGSAITDFLVTDAG